MISKLFLFLSGGIALVDSLDIYNYYELSVQKWCSSEYMIHGLWPQTNSTSYPEYCKAVSYTNPNGTLLTNMNTYWRGCDDTLWKHEWEKHGSCIQEQNNMDEYTFFNTTLSLFLENTKLLEKCTDQECILGCFDLDFNAMKCESKQ